MQTMVSSALEHFHVFIGPIRPFCEKLLRQITAAIYPAYSDSVWIPHVQFLPPGLTAEKAEPFSVLS